MTTVLAVDLGGTKTTTARVDDHGAVTERITEPADRTLNDAVSRIAARVGEARAVGVVVPGIYTPSTGCAWCPNLWGADEVPLLEKVATGSTVAAVAIAMALVAETRARLAAAGHELHTFVSPNVAGTRPDHNLRVFDAYARKWYERGPEPVVP